MLNKFREAEAIIPYREQNHREHFHQGEPIRAVLKKVEETPKGPRLILSRADPLFVKALFKLEVPEIQQQIVEIRAIAREAGVSHAAPYHHFADREALLAANSPRVFWKRSHRSGSFT